MRMIPDLKFVLIVSFLVLTGCVTTMSPSQPNPSYSGELPASLVFLSQENAVLAKELTKLPEIIDGISKADEIIIKTIAEIYSENPQKIDTTFEQMYQVGIPDIRKYCSPLQAIFWLIEDNNIKSAKKILIEKYELRYLLNSAWKFPKKHSQKELTFLFNQIIDSELKEHIQDLIDMELDVTLYQELITKLNASPEFFKEKTFQKLNDIKRKQKNTKNSYRWKNYSAVIDRLNAPELIDYYLDSTFTYETTIYPKSASQTLKDGIGDCKAYAIVSYTCLMKAGYDTYLYTMDPQSMSGHTICVFKKDQTLYSIDNTKLGLAGPYESRSEINREFNFVNKPALVESLGQLYSRFN